MRVLRPSDSLEGLSGKSVFLAGPTPRSESIASWRPDAFRMLEAFGFAGDILAPEPFAGAFDVQVNWEYRGLEGCNVICFWVPRHLQDLPGFTTNVEFGRYVNSGRILYGRPNGAPKTRYLDWLYSKMTGKEPFESLPEMLRQVVSQLL